MPKPKTLTELHLQDLNVSLGVINDWFKFNKTIRVRRTVITSQFLKFYPSSLEDLIPLALCLTVFSSVWTVKPSSEVQVQSQNQFSSVGIWVSGKPCAPCKKYSVQSDNLVHIMKIMIITYKKRTEVFLKIYWAVLTVPSFDSSATKDSQKDFTYIVLHQPPMSPNLPLTFIWSTDHHIGTKSDLKGMFILFS